MSSLHPHFHFHSLELALGQVGISICQRASSVWEARLPGMSQGVVLVLEDNVLSFRCELPALPEPAVCLSRNDVWVQWVRWNGLWPGPAAFCLSEAGDLRLEADVLLRPQGRSLDYVLAALRGMERGWRFYEAMMRASDPGRCGADWGEGKVPVAGGGLELPLLAREVGWPFRSREDGSLSFGLETGTRWHQALLAGTAPGPVSLWVEVVDWGCLSAVSRQALALLLLRLNGLLRLVRAALVGRADGVLGVLGVSWPCLPGPEDLGPALESLAVAGRLFGEVGEPLFSAGLAEKYLELASAAPCNPT